MSGANRVHADAPARHRPQSPLPADPARPAPRGAEDVLRDAQARPDGIALLFSAAECAAIWFGVHPEVVLAARDLARSRGLADTAPAEP
jgi:hypothetical protein